MKKLNQLGFATVIFGLITVFGIINTSAQNISIDGTDPRKELTVNIDEARPGDVLMELAKTFKFNIEGLEESNLGSEFSAEFKGNLEKILLHLLKNTNHLIVRMPNNTAGIAKIVIINNSQGDDNDDEDALSNSTPILPGITRSPEKD